MNPCEKLGEDTNVLYDSMKEKCDRKSDPNSLHSFQAQEKNTGQRPIINNRGLMEESNKPKQKKAKKFEENQNMIEDCCIRDIIKEYVIREEKKMSIESTEGREANYLSNPNQGEKSASKINKPINKSDKIFN